MSGERPGSERLPPQNLDAERSVLGSLLRDNHVISDVVNTVQPEHFYTDAHQKIYIGIVELYLHRGQPADLVTLADYLEQEKQLADVGGYSYLAILWDAAPTAANAEFYAKIVRDKGMVRALIHASNEILRDAYDQAQPAEELLGSAERKIFDIANKGVIGQTYNLVDVMEEAYKRIDQRLERGYKEVSGLATGYIDLDDKTAGLHNSELTILAARPSVGKTAFALNIARHIIVEDRHPVFFVSLEMSRIELAERLLCCQAKVDGHKLRKGALSSDDMDRLIQAGGELRKSKFFIDDSPAQTMVRIAANSRRLLLREEIKLVIIDYLQLIEPENRRDPRQEQVAQTSRRLKFLAKELNIPVLALAQVNRAAEDRQDHRPRLADLRESGCLVGDSLVTLADSGERVPIRELVGRSGFQVWALDEVSLKLKPAEVTHAFATGRKPVFRLVTCLGRMVRATGNHKFRSFDGWKRLDQLVIGERIAAVTQERTLAALAASDVYCDEIVSITPDGEDEVYDLTVPGPSNFVCGDIIVHNSIEQDADTVMMLHRPELYEPGQNEGTIEIIIAKQRNGPTGEITLTYLKQFMRFENFAIGVPFE